MHAQHIQKIEAPTLDSAGHKDKLEAMELCAKSELNAVHLLFTKKFLMCSTILLFFSKCTNLVFEIDMCRLFDD